MVLEYWENVINSRMGAYYPDKDNDRILEFSTNLSPLTKISLDFFANVISQKNVIVNFPDFKIRPASLFSYVFSEKFDKSIYIMADERGESLNSKSNLSLNKNHYLLCDYNSLFIIELSESFSF